MSCVVMISNRASSAAKAENGFAGGSAAALRVALEEHAGLWPGWSGGVSNSGFGQLKTQSLGAGSLATFDLSKEEHQGFYLGFANQVLWPALHGRTDLIRFDSRAYKTYVAEIELLPGRINGQYGDVSRNPVRFVNGRLTHRHLARLYRQCRESFVTPLDDGMNLVAKEYIAAQNPAAPDGLVLSCCAGATEQLNTALIVNPYDLDSMADVLRCAIVMSRGERRLRWARAIAVLRSSDIYHWITRFLDALGTPQRIRPVESSVGALAAAV